MRAYSEDLRQRIFEDCDGGMTTRVVATKYRVSESWVRRLKQRRREKGEVSARRRQKFRTPILAPHYERIQALIAAQPDLTLQELRAQLGLVVSLTALWEAVGRLGLSLKKKSFGPRSKIVRM